MSTYYIPLSLDEWNDFLQNKEHEICNVFVSNHNLLQILLTVSAEKYTLSRFLPFAEAVRLAIAVIAIWRKPEQKEIM